MSEGTFLAAENVTKEYVFASGTLHAVADVSLSAVRGEMVSIMGHSGSGKTTLLSIIGGLTRPDSGSVRLNGADLWAMSDSERSSFRNRGIGFIYQFASLIPTLTALENILLPTAFGGFSQARPGQAKELLAMVGMADKADSYPSHLSGGQQRRIAIARAFINSPELVLADEPTGDLDEKTEQEILELFRAMNRDCRTTFVIVTHSREVAMLAGTRLSMQDGRISLLDSVS